MNKEVASLVDTTQGWVAHHVPEIARDVMDVIVYLLPGALVLTVVALVYKIAKRFVLGAMRRQGRREVQVHRAHSLLKYAFVLTGIVLLVISLSGSFAAMGLGLGFLGMLMGWSLQRPVTGLAAWIMVMAKRPFQIGDRIIFQDVTGDVLDISPTHILLGEVGGTIPGEEASRRIILIPNALLFDQMVINYAHTESFEEAKFILDEVPVRISYRSDYRLTEQTLIDCATEVTREIIEETGETPFVRAELFHSGITMRVRYQSIAVERERIASEVLGKIIEAIHQNDSIEFAYRHVTIEPPPDDWEPPDPPLSLPKRDP
ncbi:MAG: mechanosensitive ion channel family protein [Gemmatimonadaceae bacterium]|nr:mechanosensitive ion channel family protein [Gemmatimonadaceae bacterium]